MSKLFGVGAFELSKSHYATEYVNASDGIKQLVELYEKVIALLDSHISESSYIGNESVQLFVYSFNWVVCQRNYQKTVMWKDVLKALDDISSSYPQIREDLLAIKQNILLVA